MVVALREEVKCGGRLVKGVRRMCGGVGVGREVEWGVQERRSICIIPPRSIDWPGFIRNSRPEELETEF